MEDLNASIKIYSIYTLVILIYVIFITFEKKSPMPTLSPLKITEMVRMSGKFILNSQ